MLDLRHGFWKSIFVADNSTFSYECFIDRHFDWLIKKNGSLLDKTLFIITQSISFIQFNILQIYTRDKLYPVSQNTAPTPNIGVFPLSIHADV